MGVDYPHAALVECPKCGALPRDECETDKGVRWHVIRHQEGVRAYLRAASGRAREYRARRLDRWRRGVP